MAWEQVAPVPTLPMEKVSNDSSNCSGWRRWSSSSTVTAISPGLASSNGTTSLLHTSASGSWRVLQFLGGRCDGNVALVSMRRALATLMPVLAAAASWLQWTRNVLYVVT